MESAGTRVSDTAEWDLRDACLDNAIIDAHSSGRSLPEHPILIGTLLSIEVDNQRFLLFLVDVLDYLIQVFVDEHGKNGSKDFVLHNPAVLLRFQDNCGLKVEILVGVRVSNDYLSAVVFHVGAEPVIVELIYNL